MEGMDGRWKDGRWKEDVWEKIEIAERELESSG